MKLNRRTFLGTASAATASLYAPAVLGQSRPRVVVIGGGSGGGTAARYIASDSNGAIEVTLIEPSRQYYTCYFSNLYLGGFWEFDDLGHDYGNMALRGVNVVHDWATGVDRDAKSVMLGSGGAIPYDRLVVSPGIDFVEGSVPGWSVAAQNRMPHSYKAGSQTELLKAQVENMREGGTYCMIAPPNPYRCPPGPYERAAMVAHYFRQHKPRSKVLLLDAKDAFSKQALFEQGWRQVYGDMIEWVGFSGDGEVVRVDAGERSVETAFGQRHQAAVINVIPPQQAGYIARQAGVTDRSGWAPVKAGTFESSLVPNVYVIGDAAVAAPMPKSAFCAHSQAGVTAAAVLASLADRPPPEPVWLNTCFSLIDADYAISISGHYRLVDGEIRELAGGVSPLVATTEFRGREAEHARNWYAAMTQSIWGA